MNNLIRSLFFVFILSSAGFLIIPEAHALFGMGDSKAKQGQWSDMPSQGMNRDTQKRMDKMRRESAKRREKIHKTKDKDKKKAAKKLSKKHRENREAQSGANQSREGRASSPNKGSKKQGEVPLVVKYIPPGGDSSQAVVLSDQEQTLSN